MAAVRAVDEGLGADQSLREEVVEERYLVRLAVLGEQVGQMAVVVVRLELAVPGVQDQLAPLRAIVDSLAGRSFPVECLVNRLQVCELAFAVLVQLNRVELDVDLILLGLVEPGGVLHTAAVAVYRDLDGPLVCLVRVAPDELTVRAGGLLPLGQLAVLVQPREGILQAVGRADEACELSFGFAALEGLQVEERNAGRGGVATAPAGIAARVEVDRPTDVAAGTTSASRASRATRSAFVGGFVAAVVAAGEEGEEEESGGGDELLHGDFL